MSDMKNYQRESLISNKAWGYNNSTSTFTVGFKDLKYWDLEQILESDII